MPRHAEKFLTNYDPDRIVKAKDNTDTLYLHLQTLKVCYDEIACRLFPCTLDEREDVWYHILLIKSI